MDQAVNHHRSEQESALGILADSRNRSDQGFPSEKDHRGIIGQEKQGSLDEGSVSPRI